ncbi:MAG TPA: endolytic transglycosylase MltG [Micavibrio sp.]|nr:endolytic transglycosylase MltG [Micavibrio sp.]
MKKIFLTVVLLGVAAIFAAGAWFFVALKNAHDPGPLPENKIVLIERGKGVAAIAEILESEGVIDSSLIFKILSRVEPDQRPLKAGEYEFTANVTMAEAMKMMREGKVYDRKVTFPEGVTSWQIVETLKELPDMKGEIADIPPEGSLLPQTYHYIRNDDRNVLLGKMKEGMTKTMAELWPARAPDLPVTTEAEAMALASIVEKETGVASERKRVAGVFVNRLKKGMPLQSDPTVIYGITKGEVKSEGQGPIGRRLLTKDLETHSPYNTYLNPGLPPTPIANPGRESIEAVLHPEAHDYIYFVADGTGGHVFARTLAEHNSNVARWRKIRRSR